MLVSVIIPVHKLNPFFKECIASVLAQTYKNIEVLIVCNGNLKIKDCKSYINSSDKRFIFLKSLEGRHNARNKGVKEAKGTYIQFLDYDDFLFSSKIEKQIEQFSLNANCSISICKWKKFNKNIKEYYKFPFERIFNESVVNSQNLYEMLGKFGGFLATSSWLINVSCIGDAKWVDVPNDDAVFLSEILVQEHNIIMLPEVLAGYRIHDQNVSSIRTKEEFDKLIDGWRIIECNIKKYENKYTIEYLLRAQKYLLSYSSVINKYRNKRIRFNIVRLIIKRFFFRLKYKC